jgi:hypothetical protein
MLNSLMNVLFQKFLMLCTDNRECDTETGRPKQSSAVAIENWTEVDPEDHCPFTNVTKFSINLKVELGFGTPGALILKNFHRDEFLLKAVSIKLPDKSTVHFPCDSCVYNTDHYAADRVFFSNKVGALPAYNPCLKSLRISMVKAEISRPSPLRTLPARFPSYSPRH